MICMYTNCIKKKMKHGPASEVDTNAGVHETCKICAGSGWHLSMKKYKQLSVPHLSFPTARKRSLMNLTRQSSASSSSPPVCGSTKGRPDKDRHGCAVQNMERS